MIFACMLYVKYTAQLKPTMHEYKQCTKGDEWRGILSQIVGWVFFLY